MIGERLKHQFTGNEAWILSYREECFEAIGLKPSLKVPVYNGSLECEFRKYSIFGGKYSEFRKDGGIVKTDEELKQMAEKHRFKQNRDFKQRLEEEDKVYRKDDIKENEEDDIRTFRFRSLERLAENERKNTKKRHGREDGENGKKHYERKPYGKNEKKAFKENRQARGKGDGFKRNSASQRRQMFSDNE